MSGTIIRLAVVGVIFVLLGLFPPFRTIEYNLITFLVVTVGVFVVEVVSGSSGETNGDPALAQRVEKFKRQSQLQGRAASSNRPGTEALPFNRQGGKTADTAGLANPAIACGTDSSSVTVPDSCSASGAGDAGGD